MSVITILVKLASRSLASLIGTTPFFDHTCRALAIGRRRGLVTAALVKLVSVIAPIGAVNAHDIGAFEASALLLSVWVTYQRPVRALRETFQPRKVYVAPSNTLAEVTRGASTSWGRRLAPISSEETGWTRLAA